MNKNITHLSCCGNCMNCNNNYFGMKISGFDSKYKLCYPGESFDFANNTLLCEKGHYPKYFDNCCDDWQGDRQSIKVRKID